MLSSKGTAKASFLVTFLIIFLICGVYCFFMMKDYFTFSSKNSEERKESNNYEVTLNNVTKKYINAYYSDLKEDEQLIIKLSTLKKYGYIDLNCTGYSIVKKDVKLKIESYVKCDDYVTPNYNSEYE